MNKSLLLESLRPFGQEHLVAFWDSLDHDAKTRLSAEIAAIDFEQIAKLVAGDDEKVDFAGLAARAKSPPAVRADGSGGKWSIADAVAAGERALRSGQIGMILVAGGQGTRLGFDRPKGLFPIGPISGRNLFQMHLDRLQAVAKHYGRPIPLYLMTSPATHADTVEYLEANQWLGFSRDLLQVFCQGVMPAVERDTGKVILESRDRLALSPDGHGGLVAALAKSGCLQHAFDFGVQHFYYAQIDNPLVATCDASFIGHHLLAASDMTTQVVRKRHAMERVGNVVSIDGRVQIIEYSDLPEAAARRTNADGSLALWAGNIAVHMFRAEFLLRAAQNPERLPFHRALKKVATINASGESIQPTSPNAIKFERFIFDLLPSADNAFVVEGFAHDVFAPVKNAEGAESDTPSSSREAILAQHRRWLELAGVFVAPGVKVEIHPRLGFDATTVAMTVAPGLKIEQDTYLH